MESIEYIIMFIKDQIFINQMELFTLELEIKIIKFMDLVIINFIIKLIIFKALEINLIMN
jgi:hypothetical protein